MLHLRLIFGSLMAAFFAGLVVLDGWWDGSITLSRSDDGDCQGALLTGLVVLMVVVSTREMGALARLRGIRLSVVVTAVGASLLATAWFWARQFHWNLGLYWAVVSVATLVALVLDQVRRDGHRQMMAQCGLGTLVLLYLGGMGAFGLAIRIEYGLWAFLIFVFVIKASDIGAYTVGRLFGRHPFAPRISPAKTWEGLAGAVLFAVILALSLGRLTGLLSWAAAVVFGAIFAVVGQLGDLTESLFKRDAAAKDSSRAVPGFGGVLDVLDSPLFAAPFVYLFWVIHGGAGT